MVKENSKQSDRSSSHHHDRQTEREEEDALVSSPTPSRGLTDSVFAHPTTNSAATAATVLTSERTGDGQVRLSSIRGSPLTSVSSHSPLLLKPHVSRFPSFFFSATIFSFLPPYRAWEGAEGPRQIEQHQAMRRIILSVRSPTHLIR